VQKQIKSGLGQLLKRHIAEVQNAKFKSHVQKKNGRVVWIYDKDTEWHNSLN